MIKPILSIIIISYNTKKITKECLQSIFKSKISFPYEIIVVDNASTDNTKEMLQEVIREKLKVKSCNLEFKIILNKENLGFVKANNQAVKIAKSEYLLFLNSDVIVLDNAIEKLFIFYQQNESKIQFLGGKLLNKDLTPQPSCGPFYSLPVVFAALFLKGDYWGLTRYSPNKIKKVDWISGACILTKKEYFEKLGGFDENIFMYMEEIDLLYRAKKINYQTFFYPEAQFIHYGSASSGKRTFPILQVYRGLLYFYKKHHSFISLFFLKLMLKLKALIAIFLGRLTKNQYLKKTYEQAYQMVKLA